MNIEKVEKSNKTTAVITSDDKIITDIQSVLGFDDDSKV